MGTFSSRDLQSRTCGRRCVSARAVIWLVRPPDMASHPLRAVKNALLPMGPGVRRLPLGIGRGLRLEIDFRHHSKLYLGLYEIELNRHLRRLCYPGARSFDVGGHIGYDALVLARLSGSDVVTFEADERLCAVIQRAAASNPGFVERINVVCALVGETVDPTTKRISLDGFVQSQNVEPPDFMKLDVEGAEAAVLRGAQSIFVERRPNLIVETHGAEVERECIQILRGHGYTPEIVSARRWIPDNRPTEHNRWIVCAGNAQA